jgi:hypothetical protein
MQHALQRQLRRDLWGAQSFRSLQLRHSYRRSNNDAYNQFHSAYCDSDGLSRMELPRLLHRQHLSTNPKCRLRRRRGSRYSDDGRAVPDSLPKHGLYVCRRRVRCRMLYAHNSFFPTPVYLLTAPDCDNALRNGGGPAPDGNAQCTMACTGNAAEICGGPNRLDLYSYGFGNC